MRQAERNGAAVSELVGDMAYGDGDTRAEVTQADARVVAKVPPTHNGGRFTKDQFTIDPNIPSATCPAGITTTDLRRNGKDAQGRQAHALHLPVQACKSCVLREQCVSGAGPRTIRLHHHEALLQQARRDQQRPSVQRKLRQRPIIERKVDHIMDNGARKARYRGRRQTLLQARLAAIVTNLKRLAALDTLPTSGATGRLAHAA